MTMEEAANLLPGDQVIWEDPDNWICTKILTIAAISLNGEVVTITDTQGDTLECYAEELK